MQLIYQIIYHPFVNRILLFINRSLSSVTKFQLPPSGTITIKLSGGIKFKLITNQTSYVTKLLYWNGASKFEYTPIFEKLVRKIDSFIDIGANTGYYSILATAVNKTISVHAFEPAQGPSHYLRKNIDINQFGTNIKSYDVALSDKESEVAFYEVQNAKYRYLPYNLGGVGSLKNESNSKRTSTLVKTLLLDSFVEREGIQKIDLIKIDTEGTENLILNGGHQAISMLKPIIICETLFNRIEKELEIIMRSHGYEFYNHLDQNLHRVNTLIREKDNGVRDCFFVHPEKFHLIQEFVAN
jgi:FkbM family methyltransferase